ncbi:hypothetical protein CE11_00960 [Megavirus courdo11]|uniref:Uncharacterized protein n=5 Tax=Megamimivirinae TaxID=3044648 RepID=A0A2L2DNI5_MIMIV|nr:hypothetical protein c7_L1064 [Megavirus courdo7]AFX92986.1 hypothetical protein CE11_00960 [Megavirus courdo11]AGD92841.1 hypothetical protein LBA_00923 [Megavirus lba]AVG47712.1 hypothetical protein [Acanthamoeba polyphaga mimivirus]
MIWTIIISIWFIFLGYVWSKYENSKTLNPALSYRGAVLTCGMIVGIFIGIWIGIFIGLGIGIVISSGMELGKILT